MYRYEHLPRQCSSPLDSVNVFNSFHISSCEKQFISKNAFNIIIVFFSFLYINYTLRRFSTTIGYRYLYLQIQFLFWECLLGIELPPPLPSDSFKKSEYLAKLIIEFINSLTLGGVATHNLDCIRDLVSGTLFTRPDCSHSRIIVTYSIPHTDNT